ncbi:uncharacterized protein LOC134249432 isoform X2 [Saccostrea cucullata]|uniref:uncharacterized protein LOC134249432 isoform X2 n=1 Tax=Saccostrea cuccullata TaxID=36930 RepID=UPI002ED26919
MFQLWKNQTTNVLIFSASFRVVFGFSWFEAQDKCHTHGERLAAYVPPKPSTPFWSSYHNRTSHWIGNLGCYSDQDISFKRMNHCSLSVPSAGLCQEKCTKRMPSTFLFAIQNNSCICLNEPPKIPQSQLRNCKFCIENSSFPSEQDCDDKVSYKIFLSIVIQEDIKIPASNCNKTNKCCEIHLNRINERQIPEKKNAKKALGNDFTFAFLKIWDLLKGPLEDRSTCIVFTRHTYTRFDQGNKLTDFDKSQISSCEQCLINGCSFVDCYNYVDKVFCSKTIFTSRPAVSTTHKRKTNTFPKQNWIPTSITVLINQPKTTDLNSETTVLPHTSFNISLEGKSTVITDQSSYAATTMNQHKTKDINWNVTMHWNNYTTTVEFTTNKKDEDRSHEDLIKIVAPVLAIVISAFLMCVVIKLLRRKQNLRGKRNLASQKDFSSGCVVDKNLSSPQYAEIKNKTDEHCLEECTYDLADNSNLEEERFTCNTEEESHYDHLRDNDQNKNVDEDIYNHLQIESESNYSTFTRGIELQGIVDNPYGEADFQNDT